MPAVTVAWAISWAQHWADVAPGLREIHRVLQPDGRLIIAERLSRPGAHGLAAHGLTDPQPAETVAAVTVSRVRRRPRRSLTGQAGGRSPSSVHTTPHAETG